MKKTTRTPISCSIYGSVFTLLFVVLLAGCAVNLPPGGQAGPGTYQGSVDIKLNGFRRSYLVHVPSGYSPGTPLPLVVVLHGAFDTAEGMAEVSGFSQLAERNNFIVLYPNGMGLFGFLQHWNAGHCCGKAAADELDDVGFVASTIEDISRHLSVDRRRIYLTGFSNGGMLVYRFAAERGDLLAAAAPLAASIGGRAATDAPLWTIPKPVRPVPLLVIHGLADDDIRYAGGVSLHRGGERTFLPVEESLAFWVEHNQCNSQAVERRLYRDRVIEKTWSGCREGADVTLNLLKGWGHVWPGGQFTAALSDDDPLADFDAAATIWEFFSTYRRD